MASRNRLGDDRPRRRKARYKSGSSATSWVLLIVIAAVLVVCGGPVALFAIIFGEKWMIAQRAAQDNREAEANAKISQAKLNQLRAGMTKAQVEAVLGPGRPADHSDVFFATGRFDDNFDSKRRWEAASTQGRVYIWDEFTDRIMVAFSKDPNAGGTAVGILGSIDRSRTYVETVRLP